jgi:hypothetical protein
MWLIAKEFSPDRILANDRGKQSRVVFNRGCCNQTNHQRLKYTHAMSTKETRPMLETIAQALLKRSL